MEAVILAAGKGQRMKGISKPFFKPLLEINGIPLIAYAVDYALEAGATHVVVVVSPKNEKAMLKVLARYSTRVSVAIQHKPLGPGDAALIGLRRVGGDTAMLLMSDNLMNTDKVKQLAAACSEHETSGIGVRVVSLEQASRFTRVRNLGQGEYSYVEGVELSNEDIWPGTDKVYVWCGPLIFKTTAALLTLQSASASQGDKDVELKIGPYLAKILGSYVTIADVDAMDVGIPSAYLEKVFGR